VTRKWLIRHVMLLFAVGVFLALGWWQVLRAGEGNARSIGYAFEWPLLALCAVYAWVRTLRHELRPPTEVVMEPHRPSPSAATQEPDNGPGNEPRRAPDEQPDDELAAYNRYLAGLHEAWLHEQDQRQRR